MTFSPSFEEGDHPSVDEYAEDETVEVETPTDEELMAEREECCRWHAAGGDANFSCTAMTPEEFRAQGRPRVLA